MEKNPVAGSSKLRVFLAIPFYDSFPRELEELLSRMRALPWDFRWNPPDLIHLTLYFFGSVAAEKIPMIEAAAVKAVQTVRPFSLGIEKIGFFPDMKKPRIIWAGASGDLEILFSLQSFLEKELLALGFEKPEHPFNPHLTLGRRKMGPLKAFPGGIPAFSFAPRPASSLVLYQSLLRPQGSLYKTLRVFDLPS